MPPTFRERRYRRLAGLCIAVRRAADMTVVAARPHPGVVFWRDRHLENATDDLAVFEHVEVVLVPADRRAFEDQLGRHRAASISATISLRWASKARRLDSKARSVSSAQSVGCPRSVIRRT